MQQERFKSYSDLLQYFASVLTRNNSSLLKQGGTLQEAKRIFSHFGIPDETSSVIHIAGTSGKGSTAIMIEAILRSHGYTTGLILSPHIYDVKERFQVNGELLTDKQVLEEANSLYLKWPEITKEKIGYYLYLLILGLVLIKKNKVDFQIVETGLGGRLDFTNILNQKNKICVLSRIGKDHTKILGNTYSKIAREKAGIIHQNNTVVAQYQRPLVNDIFSTISKQKHAKLYFSKVKYDTTELANKQLKPVFQQDNVSLAIKACEQAASAQGLKLDDDKIHSALNGLSIPGRFELVNYSGKTVLFDISHNSQKLNALAKSYKRLFPNELACVVFALKSDKDYRGAIKAVLPMTKRVVFTKFYANQDMSDKAQDPAAMADYAKSIGFADVEYKLSAQEAYSSLKGETNIVVTGSTYLLKEIRDLFDNSGNLAN